MTLKTVCRQWGDMSSILVYYGTFTLKKAYQKKRINNACVLNVFHVKLIPEPLENREEEDICFNYNVTCAGHEC